MLIPDVSSEWLSIIDHTADVGLVIQADTEVNLLVRAAAALAWMMGVENNNQHTDTVSIRFQTSDRGVMLADWMNEILYLIDGEMVVPVQIRSINLTTDSLAADLVIASAELRNPRYLPKAATYHDASITRQGDLFVGRVIFDI